MLQISCVIHATAEEGRWVISRTHVKSTSWNYTMSVAALNLMRECVCMCVGESPTGQVIMLYELAISSSALCAALILHRCCLLLPRPDVCLFFLCAVELESLSSIFSWTHIRLVNENITILVALLRKSKIKQKKITKQCCGYIFSKGRAGGWFFLSMASDTGHSCGKQGESLQECERNS